MEPIHAETAFLLFMEMWHWNLEESSLCDTITSPRTYWRKFLTNNEYGSFYHLFLTPLTCFRKWWGMTEPPSFSTLLFRIMLILSFMHLHFLNFIYSWLLCFHTFSALSLLHPFLFNLPHLIPHSLFSSTHSPTVRGKIHLRRLIGWKQQEMRVQKQRGNGAALSAKGRKTGKGRDYMLKIQLELGPFLLPFCLALPHWAVALEPLLPEITEGETETPIILNCTKRHITDILGFERHQE